LVPSSGVVFVNGLVAIGGALKVANMTCPENKTRSSRGAIITVSACVVNDANGGPVSDFTKLADGTKFSALPKWAATSSHAAEFVLEGEIPSKKTRLASKAPSLASDASAVERAAFATCGGTRDVFAARSKASLDEHLSKLGTSELRAAVAWCTPADLVVLESHPRVRGLAGDLLTERKAAHTSDALAVDHETYAACSHLRLRSKEMAFGAARRFDEDASVLIGAIMNARVNGGNPELVAGDLVRRTATLTVRIQELEQRINELMRGTATAPGIEWLGKNRQQVLEHDGAARAEALTELRTVVDGHLAPLLAAVRKKGEAVNKLALLSQRLQQAPGSSHPTSPYRSPSDLMKDMAVVHREMSWSSERLENLAAQFEQALNEQFLPSVPG
jgi:hypothetical protein